MLTRGIGRTLSVACIMLAFGATSCDKLGGAKKSSDETSSDDESDDTPKKKKKKKKSDDEDEPTAKPTATQTAAPAPTPAPSPTDTAPAGPNTGDVKRYPEETPDKGNLSISQAVAARKEANRSSELVLTLQPGSEVQRMARYSTFTLVTWKNKSGDHYGWVETSKAFKDTVLDAGAPKEIEGLGSTKFDAGPKIDAGKK